MQIFITKISVMTHIGGSNKVLSLFQSLSVKRKLDVTSGKLKFFVKALMLSSPGCGKSPGHLETVSLNSLKILLFSDYYCITLPGCSKYMLPCSSTRLLLLSVIPCSS